MLFRDESGLDSEAQIAAFEDTWHWTRATEETYHELVTQAPDRVSKMIGALTGFHRYKPDDGLSGDDGSQVD